MGPSVKAISVCRARMTGEMVVTSTGQMTCFTWMFSTADGQADESRHITDMSHIWFYMRVISYGKAAQHQLKVFIIQSNERSKAMDGSDRSQEQSVPT